MTALLLLAWVLDRVEPPWAVLVRDDGQVRDVLLTQLPPGTGPGDRLATPHGPRIETAARRREARALRLARLVAASGADAGDERATVDGAAASGGGTRPRAADRGGLASARSVRQVATMRRLQDHYGKRAKREGFAARSVYKLEEIDRRVGLIRKGAHVLDLGCAPGSWMQYAATAVGPKGRVVGVDQQRVTVSLPAHVRVEQIDVFSLDAAALVAEEGRFDVVISDMAPSTSGNRFTDHMRSANLCRRAMELAAQVLRPGGAFVCKVFEGEEVPALVEEVRARFDQIRRIKPKGTRTESVELYVVAQGFRGPAETPAAPEEGG
jgi:23S rRNA (uridine2552-2'-O)-methyltransferase